MKPLARGRCPIRSGNFFFFKIQGQHKESVLLQVPVLYHFIFIIAQKSCYDLHLKWINFGKAISISVR